MQEDVNRVLFAVAPAGGAAAANGHAAKKGGAATAGGGAKLSAKLRRHVLAEGAADRKQAADIAEMLDSLRVC